MRTPRLTAAAIVLAMAVTGACEPPSSIVLGDVLALSGGGPPYHFRLPLTLASRLPDAFPAVTIRHPRDALGLVKPAALELQLRALSDVEIEISYAGQTLNRLIPRAELQAAMAARQPTEPTASQAPRDAATPVDGSPRRSPARGPRDAVGAASLGTKSAPDRPPPTMVGPKTAAGQGSPAHRAGDSADLRRLEREVRRIDEEMRRLAALVEPQSAGIAAPSGRGDIGVMLRGMTVAALLAAAVASLFTGALLWHRAVAWQRRWRRLSMAARHRPSPTFTRLAPALSTASPAGLRGHVAGPPAVPRRRRVSRRVRRHLQIRVWRAKRPPRG
jgi:hypothetical protein